MKTKTVFGVFFFFFLVFCAVSSGQVFKELDKAYSKGLISADEMILNKFYYMFEPSKVNKSYIKDILKKGKCGTPLIMEYRKLKSSLSKSTQEIIEQYLIETDATTDYISSDEHFKLSYTKTGVNAVPSADDDENGVPDYVEWIADYLETSWDVEITQCGFKGPYDTQGDGYYNVSFQSMSYYGYTITSGVDGDEGTRIVLHNNYLDFQPNQDPEGTQKGAAKVTCAHEFKHASQYKHSGWSEGDWVELDAAWAEEIVFDYVNDTMLNFTGTGDPFSSPHLALDAGGTGYYEDYFWQDYLHQKFDNNSYTSAPIILAFWQRRETHQSENVLVTYDNVLQQFGSFLGDAFTEYITWNFYTGSRAISGFGYDEASIVGFPEAVLNITHSSYPVDGSGSDIDHLACQFNRLNPGGQSALTSSYNGMDNTKMNAVVTWTDGSSVTWEKISLNSTNEGIIGTATKNYGAIIPIITETTGVGYSYYYSINPSNYFNIAFTNLNGTSNLGGSFILDGNSSDPIPSGQSRNLIEYSNHKVNTNNERFTITNYKHHDWNTDLTRYKLQHDFQSQQSQNQNARFQNMNTVTIRNYIDNSFENGGSIFIHDPWYVDQSGNQPDSFLSFSSPYYPKGKYGESSGGVFLNQIYNPNNPQFPYYSIRAPLTQTSYLMQTGQTHTFYFLNWSASPANSATFQQVVDNPSDYDQKAVVFNAANAIVSANLKGTQLSSNSQAYSSSGQRKFVQTSDGWLHTVYESNGHIWYEAKPPDGDWRLIKEPGNNDPYLDDDGGSSPAMDCDNIAGWGNKVFISFKQGSSIQVYRFKFDQNSSSYAYDGMCSFPIAGSFSSPNIASSKDGYFMVVYTTSNGIKYGLGQSTLNNGISNLAKSGTISGTNSNSSSPAIAGISLEIDWSGFDIAWLQLTPPPPAPPLVSVKYCQLEYVQYENEVLNLVPTRTVSSSSMKINSNPSIISLPDGPRIGWITDMSGTYDPWQTKATMCKIYPSISYNMYNYQSKSASINKLDNDLKYYFTWSQVYYMYGWIKNNFAVCSTSPNVIKNLNTQGQHIQLCNGPNSSNMYVSSFYPYSTPYYFVKSNSLGSAGLGKTTEYSYSGKRGIVLENNNAGLYYSIGNIVVDGVSINFIPNIDEVSRRGNRDSVKYHGIKSIYNNTETVNGLLASEPFDLKKDSQIEFNDYFGVADSVAGVSVLGEKGYIVFKVELLDDASDKVIGTIKESEFTVKNLRPNELSAYKLSRGLPAGRKVKIRIVLSTNVENPQWSIIDDYMGLKDGLKKISANEISLEGSEFITDYALHRAYPNPFNPRTTIAFDLPEEARVEIVVYDLMGREVWKSAKANYSPGTYSVVWNGTNHSGQSVGTGVYLVRLNSAKFTATQKILLMK